VSCRSRQILNTPEYKSTSNPQIIARLVYRAIEWYKAWLPSREYVRHSYSFMPSFILTHIRLGPTIHSAYLTGFQTHLFAILPHTFALGFKALCASTLPQDPVSPSESPVSPVGPRPAMWDAFDLLGLIDRYESLIASVGYEHIETHVLSTCAQKWSEPMLNGLRDWMTNKMVPWMLLPYARGATTSKPSTLLAVHAIE
jgi:anaphase-promoting complex subunit 2